MSRKIYAMLLPVLAVVAFAAVPAVASAVTTKEYGTCATGTTSTQCPSGEAFTPFTEARVGVNGIKKSTEFVLEIEKEGVGTGVAIKCTVIDFVGKMWNVSKVGHSHLILVFENCKAVGAELESACTAANPINGNGIIEGVVTDEVTKEGASAEVTVTVESGFGVTCGATNFGGVTLSAKGTQAEKKAVLVFAKAGGLKFAGKPATITGEVEFVTITGSKKVYI
jgi:hypothetical protein